MTVAERIDRAIQPIVDSTMFALMRATDWPRSLIRYRATIWLAAALNGAGCLAISSLVAGLALMLFDVAVSRWAAKRELAMDERAERAGLARELNPARWIDLVFLAVFLSFQPNATFAFWAGRALVELFVVYAAATPPNPPAKKRLVFARGTAG